MSQRLNRAGYEKLIAEDIEWLMKQPRTLEREHILCVLRVSVEREYEWTPPCDCVESGRVDRGDVERCRRHGRREG